MPPKGLRQVSSARAARADKAGPSLAWDIQEASAGNGLAQSNIPTFLKWSKYYLAVGVSFPSAVKLNEWVHGRTHEI